MRRQVFSRPAVVRVKLANWRRRFGLGFWMRVFTVIFFFLSLFFFLFFFAFLLYEFFNWVVEAHKCIREKRGSLGYIYRG